jgi:3-oxoadipyl-CoA thiolase
MNPPMVGVVGLGTMGLGIAQVFAGAGHAVLATDAQARVREAAPGRLAETLGTRVAAGRLAQADQDAALARLAVVEGPDAMGDAALIVEAVVEDLAVKRALLGALEAAVAPGAVLATNTSSLAVAALAQGLRRPGRLLGLHFFNPAPAMRLVELVRHAGTSDAAAHLARTLAEGAGKTVVDAPDTPGFIVNRCARPFYGEALALLEEGRTASEVDAAMLAAGYRLGPLALIDLVGADINLAATRGLAQAMGGHPRFHVFPALERQVATGALGRKAGRGFLHPDPPGPPPADAGGHRGPYRGGAGQRGGLAPGRGRRRGRGDRRGDAPRPQPAPGAVRDPRGPRRPRGPRDPRGPRGAHHPQGTLPPGPAPGDRMTEVFLCAARRTPIGRYAGALARVRPDDMAALVIDRLLDLHPGLAVDEVILGCANQAGEDNRNVARMAVLLSRLGEAVPALTVNRLCASGLDAVIAGARAIRDGADVVIAGGVESMTRAPFVTPKPGAAFARAPEVFDSTIGWRMVNDRLAAAFGTESMGATAENVARDQGVSRLDQDAFALRAQERFDAGWHAADILPVTVAGTGGEVVALDEHPRATSLDRLAALPTPFREGGTVTAGNAAGINDGAAALILASAEGVRRYGLTPLARVGHAASAGVAPSHMGIGPVAAVGRLIARGGPHPQDCDVIELNEAFAAQVLACTRAWGLADDDARVNARGGGIALGHPLGMSGARIAATAARRLAEEGGARALVTLCVGVGQGVALELRAV